MRLLVGLLPLLLVAGAVANAAVDGIIQLQPMPVDSDLETARKALEGVEKFIKIFNSDIFVATPTKAISEIVSQALSSVISVINLSHGANSESPEAQSVRQQFRAVHAKLDTAPLQLDDVKSLIEWHTTRSAYSECELFIGTVTKMLDTYMTAPEEERDIRRRQFVAAFQSKPLAALQLYQAIVEKNATVSANLGTAAVHYTLSHRRKVVNFLLAMNRIILRGAELEIAYERLEHDEASAQVTEADWTARIEKLTNRMKELDTQCLNVWHAQMQRDVEKIALDQKGLSNSDFVGFNYRFLADKYHWRHWFSLAYNSVSGFNNHAISYCNGVHHFRTHGNRNLAVASSDIKTSRFTQENGNRLLAEAEGAGHRTKDAETWVNEINRKVGSSCEDAAFRGAICWGCNVWWMARSDRYSYRKMTVGGDVNTILFG